MKKFAVAYINFFDNELSVVIIEANNWRDALSERMRQLYPDSEPLSLSGSIKDEQQNAFDEDWLFDVTEIN